MTEPDSIDQTLLTLLQEPFPLVERPFAVFAERLGLTEAEILSRITALRYGPAGEAGKSGGGIIRQLSAIFDSRALGYQSMLVAARVPGGQLEEAAGVISGHPGVSHNYQRNHAYNLWFTLALPPETRLGLERTLEILQRLSGAEAMHPLPSIRMYKIGVKFEVGGDPAAMGETFPAPAQAVPTQPPAEAERKLIRVLQQDLPISAQPFVPWAKEVGVTVEALLAAAQRFQQTGLMRRFSAVLRHRKAGFSANAMGVWVVPEGQQEEFGMKASSFAAVSHCYARPTFADWPYNLFTMVHAKRAEQCEEVLAAIAKATGITQYEALYSTREFKKVRVKYFLGDIEDWEQVHG